MQLFYSHILKMLWILSKRMWKFFVFVALFLSFFVAPFFFPSSSDTQMINWKKQLFL